MLTGVFSSTIRTVVGNPHVREKLSIAILFRRETLFFEATSDER